MQMKIIFLFDNCSSSASRTVVGKSCIVPLWAQPVRVDSMTLKKWSYRGFQDPLPQ